MKVAVVGAGAMGGSFGGLLARAGVEVQLIDTWQEHVDAIGRDGLKIDGVAYTREQVLRQGWTLVF